MHYFIAFIDALWSYDAKLRTFKMALVYQANKFRALGVSVNSCLIQEKIIKCISLVTEIILQQTVELKTEIQSSFETLSKCPGLK